MKDVGKGTYLDFTCVIAMIKPKRMIDRLDKAFQGQ